MATHSIDINAICIERPDGKLDCTSWINNKTKFNWKPVVFAILMVFIIIMLYNILQNMKNKGGDSFSGNAKRKWKLFYSETCPHCVKQIQVLESSGKGYVEKATCRESPQECQMYSVSAVPTWINLETGEKKTGFMDLQELIRMGL